MNYLFYVLLCGQLMLADTFDLRYVARDIKEDAPWSRTGSAQDLRSDIKHELQKVLFEFVLLTPEATWDEQKPSIDTIKKSPSVLIDMIRDIYPQRDKRRQKLNAALDSLMYIKTEYLPQVQNQLNQSDAQSKKAKNTLVQEKKEHLPQFSESLDNAIGQLRQAISPQ